jgi:hypothetical protein
MKDLSDILVVFLCLVPLCGVIGGMIGERIFKRKGKP